MWLTVKELFESTFVAAFGDSPRAFGKEATAKFQSFPKPHLRTQIANNQLMNAADTLEARPHQISDAVRGFVLSEIWST
jgi:hypothetical protein